MRVLTAKGGEVPISDELRAIVALLDDGRLMVSKSHVFNPHVRGFMGRLNHTKREYSVQQCDLAVIAGFYENAATAKVQSNMQITALQLFERAVVARASDIHIRVSSRARTQILFRIHNDLTFIEEHTFDFGDQLCTTIFQAMADVSDATFEKMSRQDARISEKGKIPPNLDGIRIATSPQVDGYIVVLRLLYNDATKDLDLGRLGFNPIQSAAVETIKKKPTGVALIGGPTGSGKSTTLQRILSAIHVASQGRKNIITVEDPPEYPILGAVQTPVKNAESEEDRSREYQKAIKGSLRLDPDIIMASEIRDNPTGRLAIQAAMTGHQVWTTVHANSGLAIIDRLVDLGVSHLLITDPTIVTGLICQRLLKQLCPHCRRPLADHLHEFEPRTQERFMRVLKVDTVFVRGEGCDHCKNSGTLGRTVVAEVIVTDDRLMSYLRANDRTSAQEYITKELGVISMLEHAIQKINEGLVDPLQAEEVVGPLAEITTEPHRTGGLI
jgi:general secretion pathway protein E